VSRPIVECACCGVEGQHQGNGYITACYHRWRRAGFPPEGPPPAPISSAGFADEYRFLRDSGETHDTACDRIGVSPASEGTRLRLRRAYEGYEPRRPKKAEYLRLRQEGHSRKKAAELLGSPITSTYLWERGEMKTRPRKVAS